MLFSPGDTLSRHTSTVLFHALQEMHWADDTAGAPSGDHPGSPALSRAEQHRLCNTCANTWPGAAMNSRLIQETKGMPALIRKKKKNAKKGTQMWALFTHCWGELVVGDTPARTLSPRHRAGAALLWPVPAEPPGAVTRGPSPPAPPGATAATYPGDSPRERPSTGETSPPALPGSAGAASLSLAGSRSRVPGRARRCPSRLTEPHPRGGGGQPARPDRALRAPHSPAALNGRQISARRSRVSKGPFLPSTLVPARKTTPKSCHRASWRGKEELTRLAACTKAWLTTRGSAMSELALCPPLWNLCCFIAE